MFAVPPDNSESPARFYEKLLTLREFAHLFEYAPTVAFLMRGYPQIEQGRAVIGTCSMPVVQGRNRKLFAWLLEEKLGFTPVFLFTFDAEWWAAATAQQREILTYHEMCHTAIAVDQFGEQRFNRETGEPVWSIRGHDVEEFNAVVARYGAWSAELEAFLQSFKGVDNA